MIIYSESFHVEHKIEADWIQWMKEVVMPEMYKTRLFKKAVFVKVISHPDESGNTYSIQYYTESKETLAVFYKDYSPKISQLFFEKYGTQALSFQTELEVIEVFDF